MFGLGEEADLLVAVDGALVEDVLEVLELIAIDDQQLVFVELDFQGASGLSTARPVQPSFSSMSSYSQRTLFSTGRSICSR